MKNNCQGLQKHAKLKQKIAPRKKKYSLKQHLCKVTSHAPLVDDLQNRFIQQQTTNEFFELFHKNFRVILTQNSQQQENHRNHKQYLLPTSRTNQHSKKTQNSHNKITSRNSSKNKNSNKTQSRQKRKSESVRKNTTAKSEKPTLRKGSCKSCKTVSRKKKQLNSFVSIVPVIRI